MGSVYVGNGTDGDWLEGYIACESHLQLSAESIDNLNLVTIDQRAP
jgi:hypothetical protein